MNRRTVLTLASAAAVGALAARADALQPASPKSASPGAVPKPKQTTLGLYMTPREAAEAMAKDGARTLFVDVRTRAEMMFTGWAPLPTGSRFSENELVSVSISETVSRAGGGIS